MFQHRSAIEYGIVGLGRFGLALAKTLAEAGKEVIVVDNNESKVKQLRNIVSDAFVIGTLDKESSLTITSQSLLEWLESPYFIFSEIRA